MGVREGSEASRIQSVMVRPRCFRRCDWPHQRARSGIREGADLRPGHIVASVRRRSTTWPRCARRSRSQSPPTVVEFDGPEGVTRPQVVAAVEKATVSAIKQA